ncbi:MAG: prepilin peptidase [Candidatus Diapherotrites archaeon]|nr:prepilin peptidase [Candidatus Diapherotrites archaeon]
MFELLGVAIAIIGTAVVSHTDFKTGYMPDRYTHAMLLLGAALLPLYSGLEAAVPYYLIAAGVFAASFIFYTFGQLGGGDVKLFTALALLLPIYPAQLVALGFNPIIAPYPFVVSVFFASAVMAMAVVSIDYLRRLHEDRKKIKDFRAKSFRGLLYSALTLPLAVIWVYLSPMMTIVAVPLALGTFAMAFKEDILRLYVVRKKAVKDLNDDDVIALELMSPSMKKKLGLGSRKTFLEMELKAIKKTARKHGIKQIIVQENLPKFGVFILASLLLNLMVGDTLLWLLFT